MNWKDELHNYLNENNLLRISYLNDNVLEPAIKNFVEELKRFDRLEKSNWIKKLDKNEPNSTFKINIPHIKHDYEGAYSLNPEFSAKIYIYINKLFFEVYYNFETKEIIGDKLNSDIDSLIAESNNLKIEEVLKLKTEAQKEEVGVNYLGAVGTEYWAMLNKIKSLKIFPLKESFEINHMADSDEISKRLFSLYKENCDVYNQLFEAEKK
jgi:hypothetical protein